MAGEVPPASPAPGVKIEHDVEEPTTLVAEAPGEPKGKGEAEEEYVKAERPAAARRRRLVRKTSAAKARAGRPGKRRQRAKPRASAEVKRELKQRAGRAATPARRFRLRGKGTEAGQAGARRRQAARTRRRSAKPEVKAEPAEEEEEAEDDDEEGGEAKEERGRRRGRRRQSGSGPKAEGRVKKEVEPPSFEARLPFFLAQCRAFHLAKRIWRPSRPCCLPNCVLNLRPDDSGDTCYDRLTKEQRRRLRATVEGDEAHAKTQRGSASVRSFNLLLHPEREPAFTVRRKRILDNDLPSGSNQASSSTRVRSQAFRGYTYLPEGDVIGGEAVTVAAAVERAKARQEKQLFSKTRGDRKLSGVRGVQWNKGTKSWVAVWRDAESGMTRKFKSFPVERYEAAGRSKEDAERASLNEAIIFREKLVSEGKIKVQEDNDNKGIFWNKQRRGWDVYFRVHGKKLRGGYFRPLDDTPEAVEKARLAAAECRRQLEFKHGRYGSSIQTEVLQATADDEAEGLKPARPGANAKRRSGTRKRSAPPPAAPKAVPKASPQAAAPKAALKAAPQAAPKAAAKADPKAAPQTAPQAAPQKGGKKAVEAAPQKAAKKSAEAPVAGAKRGQAALADAPAPASAAKAVAPASGAKRAQAALTDSEAASSAAKRRQAALVDVTWRRYGGVWKIHMWVNGKLDKRLQQRTGTPSQIESELLAACRDFDES